jgi:hypothetical protein
MVVSSAVNNNSELMPTRGIGFRLHDERVAAPADGHAASGARAASDALTSSGRAGSSRNLDGQVRI